MRILVVDDYPDSVETTCMLLRLLGHQPMPARSGHEAIECAHGCEPELALVDIGLPDVSGFEVASMLRRRVRDIYVVAVTGWTRPSVAAQAVQLGFHDWIVKPASTSRLIEVLGAARAHKNRE